VTAIQGSCCLAVWVPLLAGVAQAAGLEDLPKRKPGLWEMSVIAEDGKRLPGTSRLCIDAATDAALTEFALGATSRICSKRELRVSGSVATIDTVCQVGGSKQTTHSTITYRGDSAYRTEVHARYDPPFLGKSDSTTAQEAKWTGPCPADMKPGDLVTPSGMKFNLRKLASVKGK
jgi:Protein of unknown function (DUF3617)